MEQVQIGASSAAAAYDMAEVSDRSEVTLTTPFGSRQGQASAWHAARQARGISPGMASGIACPRQS
jgi:hypothetical protein